jgi:predicted metal-dependent peptidase
MSQKKDEIVDLQKNISNRIVQSSKNELSVSMRFLDYALSKMYFVPNFSIPTIQTDGRMIYFNPEFLIEQYKTSRFLCNRTQFHMLLHCILHHPFDSLHKKPEVWDVAVDIAVEYILDGIKSKSIDYALDKPKKQSIYNALSSLKYKNAQSIYYKLMESPSLLQLALESAELFKLDEHKIWHKISKSQGDIDQESSENNEADIDNDNDEDADKEHPNPEEMETKIEFKDENDDGEQQESDIDLKQNIQDFLNQKELEDLQKEWEEISEKMEVELESFSNNIGEDSGDLLQIIQLNNRKKYDYGAFLRKFAALQEENIVNDEEFDYIYYTFGLCMYENMPLIEPLEYKETEKIREFVIAIDTSGSCSNGLIQKFLEYTYSILTSSEVFSSKVNIHIIQCDADIKKDDKVTDSQEMEDFLSEFTAFGNGGTDFRPVFKYVDELVEKKEFYNLRGLIYFTDGYGVFPEMPPQNYTTAFVFVDEEARGVGVPPWAIKIVLSQDEIQSLEY